MSSIRISSSDVPVPVRPDVAALDLIVLVSVVVNIASAPSCLEVTTRLEHHADVVSERICVRTPPVADPEHGHHGEWLVRIRLGAPSLSEGVSATLRNMAEVGTIALADGFTVSRDTKLDDPVDRASVLSRVSVQMKLQTWISPCLSASGETSTVRRPIHTLRSLHQIAEDRGEAEVRAHLLGPGRARSSRRLTCWSREICAPRSLPALNAPQSRSFSRP